ncbi:flagellar hook-basal body complex protein FliE [Capsulimonas corticalis]|uniref:Flagellar hook-basal body complex protein FliE n=1 Tax=Capsulimonas corticalis TaxID=2219043 RepID=A0A402CSY4_9BACT|nr:flagellar hook-basal body complex protein FliE [Capsulimonas corticalis]BDI30918.1 flagellar hook-basal body complex protein FliE [Capsulimonas corticalis]
MMNLFSPIAASGTISPAGLGQAAASLMGGAGDPNALTPSFSQTLVSAMNSVNTAQNHAGALAQDFAVGKTSDIHGVMIASEQATVALQMTTQIRNKVVEAYQEVMRMSM